MDDYSYMCGECFQFCDNIDNFVHHVCVANVEGTNTQENRTDLQKRDSVKFIATDPGTSEPVITYSSTVQNVNEKICDPISKDGLKTSESYLSAGQEYSDLELTEDEDVTVEIGEKKRKKYHAMADEYRVNRIMRDKDFKLGRTHLYSFKDTLGDWDERSTKLLIHFIQNYPKSHFLLSTRAERRLGHWENIHKEMETAGYTFTVLQLRMRWREVLQKYRWTVDYNDNHEIKKKCEYFDEMIELFGDWDREATQCLLKQMHQLSLENQKKKILRIGYSGWERITSSLNCEGHRFTIDMVEARWRNMVTMYKTMVDHNALPNVEPQTVAFKVDLEKILNYVPKRRQIYEKVKGRSVKMERFPTNGIKVLLQVYKDCIDQFMEPKIKNTSVWDEIKQKLEEEGYEYTTLKLKEILNGIIKGYEKSQLHNSLPGAIRRDVPYYRELSEIYGTHGRWPHIQTSRTKDMRNKRKFRLRLQASQQLWSSEESKALLEIYPDVLETHVNQNVSHQASDLWLQVAKAYAATGFPKRDVPEIAVHIGLLRMGYAQGNLFPFLEEMRKVKETEEAVCYSPDVSKFTGEVEVIYWCHEAVKCLLELYLEHQASVTQHSSKEEVFIKIKDDMESLGYGYTKDQIQDHFKTLITQYRTRTSKVWGEIVSSRKSSNPTCAPYLGLLQKVYQLRRKLSLSWTAGVMPLKDEAVNVVYKVACEKSEEVFLDSVCSDEKKIIPQLIEQIQSYIRTKRLLDDIPRTRQIRLHLISALRRFHEGNEDNVHIAKLHEVLEANGMVNFFMSLKKQGNFIATSRSLKKQREDQRSRKRAGKKQGHTKHENRQSDSDSSDNLCHSMVNYEKSSLLPQVESHNLDDNCMGNVCKGGKSYKVIDMKPNKKSHISVKRSSADQAGSSKGIDSQSCAFSVNIENDSFLDEKYCKTSNLEFEVNSHIIHSEKSDLSNQLSSGMQTVSCGSDLILDKISGDLRSEITVPVLGESSILDQSTKIDYDESGNCSEKRNHEQFSVNASGSGTANIDGSVPYTIMKNELCSESGSRKIRTEAETRLIRTRSGRKTRFTFFSHSLNDDFEEEDKMTMDECVSFPRNSAPKDKSTQTSVNVAIKRKRGRPRKPIVSSSNVQLTMEKDSQYAKKSHASNLELTKKPLQDVVCISKDTSSTVNVCNEEDDDKMRAPGNPVSYDKINAIRKPDDDDVKNCDLGEFVTAALQSHHEERIEKENALLNILEKHHGEESIVLKQMLDIFKNLKCILDGKH